MEAQPEFPKELQYIMDWYFSIRTDGRITWTEIRSWSLLTCNQPSIWEVELLRDLDKIYWNSVNE